MTKLLILLTIFISTPAICECVHEKQILGSKILEESKFHNIFIAQDDAKFIHFSKVNLNPNKKYTVQLFDKVSRIKSKSNNPHEDYNRKYVEYYTYKRMQDYIESNRELILKAGFEIRIVGQSIEGRDLYAITPKKLTDRKTILMFGRHHGDEGTANWIIEGFFDEYLKNKEFQDTYQLVLYPMINPDGAEAHSRYNANGRDLNRSWNKSLSRSYDEIKFIHGDLKPIMNKIGKNIFIALDMHGSFTEDFIYRVKKDYVSRDFYNLQSNFTDELGAFDLWQRGNVKLSNGNKAMARIVLINHYKKNAMTHETIRNIKLDNNQGRDIQALKDQGIAVVKTIQSLY